LIQTGRKNGYSEPKQRKQRNKQSHRNGNGDRHRKADRSPSIGPPGRFRLRRRQVQDWCKLRPIPGDMWFVWQKYFANDWEIYDTLNREVVALGSKMMMKKQLRSLCPARVEPVEEVIGVEFELALAGD